MHTPDDLMAKIGNENAVADLCRVYCGYKMCAQMFDEHLVPCALGILVCRAWIPVREKATWYLVPMLRGVGGFHHEVDVSAKEIQEVHSGIGTLLGLLKTECGVEYGPASKEVEETCGKSQALRPDPALYQDQETFHNATREWEGDGLPDS